MKNRMKQLIVVVSIGLIGLALWTGTAFAQTEDPDAVPSETSALSQMIERVGPENWGAMIQRMIQMHGVEQTGQMLRWMSQHEAHDGDMPCYGDESGHMMNGWQMGMGRFGQQSDQAGRHGFGRMMGRR